MTVNRLDKFVNSTLATHLVGVRLFSPVKLLWDSPDLKSKAGVATLSFGFLCREAPKSYIRKLTLAPAVKAYQPLKKGGTVLLTVTIY